jgi:hypothetical protein
MRMRGLRGSVALLLVSAGVGVSGVSAHAEEEVAAELAADGAAQQGPAPEVREAKQKRARAQREARQEAWWKHAREVLFTDIELSGEQAREVDAIIDGQRAERTRAEELRAELGEARQKQDAKKSAELRTQLRGIRAKLKGPHARVDEMRALLTDEQRPTFDMNRARLAAEGKQTRQAGRGKRAEPPGADAN